MSHEKPGGTGGVLVQYGGVARRLGDRTAKKKIPQPNRQEKKTKRREAAGQPNRQEKNPVMKNPAERARAWCRLSKKFQIALLAALAAITSACGYRSAVADRPEAGRYAVVVLPPKEPHAEALSQVAAGMRAELARHGALRAGTHPPRVVVELARSDEQGTGIAATAAGPRARGSAVAVVARAWIEERAGAPPALDTGDMRRVGRFQPGGTVELDAEARREALRVASEGVGVALARRLLGRPVPSDEPLGGPQ